MPNRRELSDGLAVTLILVHQVKPTRRRGGVSLGELEHAIMEHVWNLGHPTTVPEVHEALTLTRGLAYTTVMTVMNRLFEKGLLERSEERRPYTYRARVSREDFSAGRMLEALGELKDKKAVLARFVDRIDPEDAELLRQLVKDLGRARR